MKNIITDYDVRLLQAYKITLIQEKYYKTKSGKSWEKNPSDIMEEVINSKEYANIFNSIQFYKKLGGSVRIKKSYTSAGLMPTRLTSINPIKNTKILRKFIIERQ